MKIKKELTEKLLNAADHGDYLSMGFTVLNVDTDGECHVVDTIATRRWIVVSDAYSFVIKYIDNDFNVIDVDAEML